jgi:hypothetical protein
MTSTPRKPSLGRETPTTPAPIVSVPDRIASGGNLSVAEFGAWAMLGRTRIYEEIQLGRLRVVKLGTRTAVPATAALDWAAQLKAA